MKRDNFREKHDSLSRSREKNKWSSKQKIEAEHSKIGKHAWHQTTKIDAYDESILEHCGITCKKIKPEEIILTYQESSDLLDKFHGIRCHTNGIIKRNMYTLDIDTTGSEILKYENLGKDNSFAKNAGAVQLSGLNANNVFKAFAMLSYKNKDDKNCKENFGHTEVQLYAEAYDDFTKKYKDKEIKPISESIRTNRYDDNFYEIGYYVNNNATKLRDTLQECGIVVNSISERSPCSTENYKHYNCRDFIQNAYTKSSKNLYFVDYIKNDNSQEVEHKFEQFNKLYLLHKKLDSNTQQFIQDQEAIILFAQGKHISETGKYYKWNIFDKNEIKDELIGLQAKAKSSDYEQTCKFDKCYYKNGESLYNGYEMFMLDKHLKSLPVESSPEKLSSYEEFPSYYKESSVIGEDSSSHQYADF